MYTVIVLVKISKSNDLVNLIISFGMYTVIVLVKLS